MASHSVSSRALVRQLWAEVRAREEARTSASVPDLPAAPALIHSSELAYLNIHWQHREFREVPDRRLVPGSKRWIRARLARFVHWMFEPYFEAEREFRAYVVRVANSTAEAHDRLATEVRTLQRSLAAEAERLAERDLLFHRITEERLDRSEDSAHDGT